MSAQLALLTPQLEQAVLQGAVSLAEAWALQDLMSMSVPGEWHEVPEPLHPMWERLCLLEATTENSLPV